MPGKAAQVQAMFARIAPRYDLLNHVLSFNLDRRWRRTAVASLGPVAGRDILDACAGTLDLAVLLARGGARVVALDFCREMLERGRDKDRRIALVEGDAMHLPFAVGRFDGATAAFGIRNLADPRVGLKALAEVLRPGGRLAILEFARPRNALVRWFYYLYFRGILPRIGGLVSGDGGAYAYLPESVLAFLEPEEMAKVLEQNGMEDVSCQRLMLGTVALVTGRRRDPTNQTPTFQPKVSR